MFHHIKCRYCVNPIGEKLWWINVELTKYILYSGKQAEPREVPRYRSVTLCQVAAVRCLQEAAHVHPGHGHRLKNFTKINRKNSTQNVPMLPRKELRTSLTEFLWSHFVKKIIEIHLLTRCSIVLPRNLLCSNRFISYFFWSHVSQSGYNKMLHLHF